jgi:pyruvate dehydrogenase E2 component (dihydrolipoamide acetyltransferase)
MATEVVMPQMGESIAEGTITKWLVKVGDKVERDQPLFEISTDKVDAEIPSPADGVVLEIKVEEGETVPVDDVVALIGEEGEQPVKAAEKTETAEPEPEEKAAAPAEGAEEEAPEAAGEEKEGKEDEETVGAEAAAKAAEQEVEDEEAAHMRQFASPVVKKMAEEEDLDLSQIEGSGIHGRVTKQDVFSYLEEREEAPAEEPPARPEREEEERAAAAPAAATAPAPAEKEAAPAAPPKPEAGEFFVPAYREGEEVEIEPMSRIRQITAAHMRYSKDTSAHVTTLFEFDFSRLARIRKAAKRGFEKANGTKLSYMPFVIKAVAAALKAHPKVNASIDGTDIVYKKHINVGIAVALERGLVVPVIRDADQLSLTGIAKTGNDLADRARTKKLSPDELEGGTFTITNPGVFGSLFGTPIINQPQVAILGLGAIEKRPVVMQDDNGNDAIAIRTMAYMPITYDHRLIDGADADHFMNDIKKMIEEDSWAELEPFM